jgi:hypothetical protein
LEGLKPCSEYLKVWGCLANVMLPKPKRRKIGSKTCDCTFIGHACNNSYYKFLIIKSNVLYYNTIIESKKVIFFEHMFPFKNKEKLLHESSITS